MKLLNSSLTLSLKLIFFVTFTVGLLIMAILNTYLNRSYYENHFAEKLAEIQSKQIGKILEEKREMIPFGIGAEKINEIFKETFTANNIKQVVDIVFDSVEKYEGENIFVDLSFIKTKEAEFIDKLAELVAESGGLSNEEKNHIVKNINLGIPGSFEIENTNASVNKVLQGIKFILTEKLIVNLVVLVFMFLPLVGIFTLNIHPYYKGMRKVGTALIAAGIGASLIEVAARFVIKALSSNENFTNSLSELPGSFNLETVNEIFELAFGKILQIITVTGLITLGIGVALYVISMQGVKLALHYKDAKRTIKT